jgi:hypothetical protein
VEPKGISRRSFLALAGSGAALASLGRVRAADLGAAPSAAEAGAPAFFSADEADILTHVVERMVESGLPNAPPVRETGAVAAIDRLCRGLDPELSRPLPALLRAVEWGPYVFDWTFARFRALDPAAQEASLRGWMTSRFALRRLGFRALKNLAFLGWYSQPATWQSIGYAGPLVGRPGGGAP